MAEHKTYPPVPFRKGEVIIRGSKNGKSELITKIESDNNSSTMTLVPVSKCKIIRAIQKFYYLKIKYIK